jgi:uncharacterized protein (UPF0147 family)
MSDRPGLLAIRAKIGAHVFEFWDEVAPGIEVTSGWRRLGMVRVRLGGRPAVQVGRLLRNVSNDTGVAPDVRANAAYWASAVRRTMDYRDLQTLAWVLQDVSQERAVPLLQRRSARYWAANIEART